MVSLIDRRLMLALSEAKIWTLAVICTTNTLIAHWSRTWPQHRPRTPQLSIYTSITTVQAPTTIAKQSTSHSTPPRPIRTYRLQSRLRWTQIGSQTNFTQMQKATTAHWSIRIIKIKWPRVTFQLPSSTYQLSYDSSQAPQSISMCLIFRSCAVTQLTMRVIRLRLHSKYQ